MGNLELEWSEDHPAVGECGVKAAQLLCRLKLCRERMNLDECCAFLLSYQRRIAFTATVPDRIGRGIEKKKKIEGGHLPKYSFQGRENALSPR